MQEFQDASAEDTAPTPSLGSPKAATVARVRDRLPFDPHRLQSLKSRIAQVVDEGGAQNNRPVVISFAQPTVSGAEEFDLAGQMKNDRVEPVKGRMRPWAVVIAMVLVIAVMIAAWQLSAPAGIDPIASSTTAQQ